MRWPFSAVDWLAFSGPGLALLVLLPYKFEGKSGISIAGNNAPYVAIIVCFSLSTVSGFYFSKATKASPVRPFVALLIGMALLVFNSVAAITIWEFGLFVANDMAA